MDYDESDRDNIQAFLRETMNADMAHEGILTKALIISEWITPDGKRYLARSPIGELTSWDIQGFCVSTLNSDDWNSAVEDDEEEE